MRTSRVVSAIIAAALLPALMGARGCSDTSGGGSSQPAPSYSPIMGPNPPTAAGPIASADNAPKLPTSRASGSGDGFDCTLTISPDATGLQVGAGIVLGTAYTFCTSKRPSELHLDLAVERFDPIMSTWYSWPPLYVSHDIPPMFPDKQRHRDSTPCQPGTYHLRVTLSGETSDAKPRPFGPVTRTGNAVYVTQADCDGPLRDR